MQPLGCGLVIQPRFNGHIIQGQVVIHHSHQHWLPHPVQIFRVNAKLSGDFGQLLPVGLRPSFIIGIDKLEGHGPGIAAKHNAVFCDNRGTIAGGGIRVQHKGRLVGDGIAAHLFLFTAIGMIWSFLGLRRIILPPRKIVLGVMGGNDVTKLPDFITGRLRFSLAKNGGIGADNFSGKFTGLIARDFSRVYTFIIKRRFGYAFVTYS